LDPLPVQLFLPEPVRHKDFLLPPSTVRFPIPRGERVLRIDSLSIPLQE
jgi:hypothetical protein